jgi:hypothetical protein
MPRAHQRSERLRHAPYGNRPHGQPTQGSIAANSMGQQSQQTTKKRELYAICKENSFELNLGGIAIMVIKDELQADDVTLVCGDFTIECTVVPRPSSSGSVESEVIDLTDEPSTESTSTQEPTAAESADVRCRDCKAVMRDGRLYENCGCVSLPSSSPSSNRKKIDKVADSMQSMFSAERPAFVSWGSRLSRVTKYHEGLCAVPSMSILPD